MSNIIQNTKQLAELKVPPLRAEITVHEDEDPRYTDDCLVQIIEKDDENSIWYEEEHGGYKHGKLHFAHVFAAAPELAQALAEETWEYSAQDKRVAVGKLASTQKPTWKNGGRIKMTQSMRRADCKSRGAKRALFAAAYPRRR